MTVCACCGKPVGHTGGRGRPRAYCSRSCRAKAYRARHRGPAEHAAPPPEAVEMAAPPRGESGPALSVGRIVHAAIELADAEGLEAVHMRRLAGHLGAGTMSLYRYVGNKDELIQLMVEATLQEVPQPNPWPCGWRAGLAYTARRDWAMYRRHPWVLRHAMVGSRMRWNHGAAVDGERALSAFDGLALSAEEQLRILLMVVTFTQGLALVHANEIELTRRTGVTGKEWWDRELAREPYVDLGATYPRLSVVFAGAMPLPLDLDRYFEEGLDELLDGIGAVLVARGVAAAGSPGADGPGADARTPPVESV